MKKKNIKLVFIVSVFVLTAVFLSLKTTNRNADDLVLSETTVKTTSGSTTPTASVPVPVSLPTQESGIASDASQNPLQDHFSPEMRKFVAWLDQGKPVRLAIGEEEAKTYYTAPRRVTADGFKLSTGPTTRMPASYRVYTGNQLLESGKKGEGISIAVVNESVSMTVTTSTGDYRIEKNQQTGQLEAITLRGNACTDGESHANCEHTKEGHFVMKYAPGVAEQEPVRQPANFSYGTETAAFDQSGHTGPSVAVNHPYFRLGSQYDASLKDITDIVVIAKSMAGDSTPANLSSKAATVFSQAGYQSDIYERQLGLRYLVMELIIVASDSAEEDPAAPYTDPNNDGNLSSYYTLERFGTWMKKYRPCTTYKQGNASCYTSIPGYVAGRASAIGWYGYHSTWSSYLVQETFARPMLNCHELGHNLGAEHTYYGMMEGGPDLNESCHEVDLGGKNITAAKQIYDYMTVTTRGAIYGPAPLRNPYEIPFGVDDDGVTTAINTAVTFNPLLNDKTSVMFGATNSLSLAEVGQVYPVAAGTATVSGNNIIFTPEVGYVGKAWFTYTLRGSVGNGGKGWLHSADVVVNIGGYGSALPLTPALSLKDDYRRTDFATPVRINPLLNDEGRGRLWSGDIDVVLSPNATTAETYSEKAFQLVSAVVQTGNGSVALETRTVVKNSSLAYGNNGYLVYTPGANEPDKVIIKYTVRDSQGNTADAYITFARTGYNNAPLAQSLTQLVNFNQAENITLRASNGFGDVLTYSIVTSPAHGSLSGLGANLTYTPEPGYVGADSFTYKASDGTADSNVATVAITVFNNTVPVATAQSVTTAEDTSKAIVLTGSDVSGYSLGFYVVTPPAHGTLTGAAPNLTYVPDANYNGSDSFSFKVNDGFVDSTPATIIINITPVNDVPVPISQTIYAIWSPLTPLPVVLTGRDVENSPLTYIISVQPKYGTLSGTSPNFIYTPTSAIDDSITFQVKDGVLTSGGYGTVSIKQKKPVKVSVTDSICAELGRDPGVFTLTRTGSTAAALTVDYTLGGTTSNDGFTDYYVDYSYYKEPTNSVTFAQNSATATVTIYPVDDSIYEGPETVTLTVIPGGPDYMVVSPSSATLTIADNDKPVVAVSASTTTITEGGSAAVLTFSRPALSPVGAMTINYTVSGSATAGIDYVAPSGSITIPDGQTTATANVAAIADNFAESPESLTVTITANAAVYNAAAPNNAVTLTLVDASGPVVVNVSASDNVATESSVVPAPNTGTFSLTRSGSPTEELTVNIVTLGTATPGSDYVALPTTVTFAAGQARATVKVTPIGDNEAEPDQTVILNVLSGIGYSVGTSTSATVNLYDDEPTQVRVEVTDGLCDDAAATNTGVFTLRRLGNRTAALTVNYTLSGTAIKGTDYTTLSGIATIAADTGSIPVTVTPVVDGVKEGTETVTLTLAVGTGYTAGTPDNGTIEIRDAGTPDVNVSVQDAICVEQPTPDTGSIRFTCASAPATDITINFKVAGTATGGTDYTMVGTNYTVDYGTMTGTATIKAGTTFVDMVVRPIDDAVVEGAESVIVTLTSGGTSYDIGDTSKQTVWINDNDSPTITVAATDNAAAEADGGTTNPGLYTFTASFAPSIDLTISYTMTGTASNGVDYDSISGTVVLPAGLTTVTLTLHPVDDEIAEGTETALLTLFNGGLYNVGATASATVTIAASDIPVANIFAVDAAAAENPKRNGLYVITLSKSVAVSTTVFYGWSGTATSGLDYPGQYSYTAVPAGSNTVTVSLSPNTDTLIEGDETVILTLGASQSTPATYTAGVNKKATVTITDGNLSTVTITSTDAAASEPVTGSALDTGAFMVTRDGLATGTLTVNLNVAGTATNGVDYTTLPSPLTFAVGETSKTITVTPLADAFTEGPETGVLTIAPGSGYTAAASPNHTATVTIGDATAPYVSWLNGFTFAPGADKTSTGDPDGDGVPNLIEYALGMNPTGANANPIGMSQLTVNGQTYLTLTVNRDPSVTNVRIDGESAGVLTDANAWSSGTTVVEVDTATSFSVRDSVPIGASNKRFFRLRFTLLP